MVVYQYKNNNMKKDRYGMSFEEFVKKEERKEFIKEVIGGLAVAVVAIAFIILLMAITNN